MNIIDQLIENMVETDWPKLDHERLAKLRGANLQRATAADIGVSINVREGGDPVEAARLLAVVDAYAKGFLPIGPCPNCDRKYGFSWGICHGEGACRCGYPARAIHRLGEEIGTLSNLVLWYHPDELVAPPRPPAGGEAGN